MANSATLVVRIISDAKGATAGVDAAAQRFGKVGDAAKRAMVPATALGVGLLAGAKKAVDAASRTQQAFGGLDAVFKSNAGQVKAWATGAANSLGLSKAAYAEFATLIGAQLKNAGVPMDQLAGKTDGLIKTGADLAAMYGGTTADAVDALSAALKGEFDPMERYGTSLSATAIKAEMVAQGTDKLTGKQAQQAKTAATLALITKQTADAHGAAAREYDSAASAQQRLSATTENMASDLGTVLLPVVSMAADALSGMAKFAAGNARAVQILAGVLAGLVVTVYAVNGAMAAYNAISAITNGIQTIMRSSLLATRVQLLALAAAQKITAAAQWALNAAMSANPIALVIIAVVALVAAFVLLYKKSATFRAFVNTVWAAIQKGAVAAANVVKRVWQVVWAAVSAYVRIYLAVARLVFNVIRSVASSVGNTVKSVFRGAWSVVASAARNAMSGARAVIEGLKRTASAVASFVKSRLGGIWSDIASAAHRAFSGMASLFTPITRAVQGVISAVQSLIGWLGRIKVPKISLPHIGGKGRAAGFVATSATTRDGSGFRATRSTGARASTAAPIVINVTGAIDPESTARQIRRILDGHDRRIGLRAS